LCQVVRLLILHKVSRLDTLRTSLPMILLYIRWFVYYYQPVRQIRFQFVNRPMHYYHPIFGLHASVLNVH
jgi:hypothetical protein